MNVKILCAAAGLAGAAVLVGQMKVNAFGSPDDGSRSGPGLSVRDAKDSAPLEQGGAADVAVCDMPNWVKHGVVGSITAYSFGTTSVNVGSVNLNWIDGSPFHPVISQNMFRLKDGKFEQIGQSWLKHGFCALQLTGCGACAAQGGCLHFLKPGCRDPYRAGLNGSPGGLGPTSERHAATGRLPGPSPPAPRRLSRLTSGGLDVGNRFENGILFCVTELNGREQIDGLVAALEAVATCDPKTAHLWSSVGCCWIAACRAVAASRCLPWTCPRPHYPARSSCVRSCRCRR